MKDQRWQTAGLLSLSRCARRASPCCFLRTLEGPGQGKERKQGDGLKPGFGWANWSTLVLCVCWCSGLSHKGVRSGESLICLDRKDQQKKPCDSKRSGLFLGKHRDGHTRGHQRKPHFCAKVQLIRKHPCQGAGNKINTQISIVSLCEQ